MRPVVFRNVQHFSNGRWEHVNLVVAGGRIACLQSDPRGFSPRARRQQHGESQTNTNSVLWR